MRISLLRSLWPNMFTMTFITISTVAFGPIDAFDSVERFDPFCLLICTHGRPLLSAPHVFLPRLHVVLHVRDKHVVLSMVASAPLTQLEDVLGPGEVHDLFSSTSESKGRILHKDGFDRREFW